MSPGSRVQTAFEQTWHGLFADPVFLGPMWRGLAVSAVWFLLALGLAALAFGRGEFADG
jgi:hypothetical protein